MTEHAYTVVIVGGGFGGLAAAKALRNTPARVILIDRSNHHLFQPLLYQVRDGGARTCADRLSDPEHTGDQSNVIVIMGEVTGVNKDQRQVLVNSEDRQGVVLSYDSLIVATGAQHSYFGHDEFERYAPGLKSLADAVAVRNKILKAFEQAEAEEDPNRHRDLLTFVLVGGGPTGVEMAAAIATLVRTSLRTDFRRIDPTTGKHLFLHLCDGSKGAKDNQVGYRGNYRDF